MAQRTPFENSTVNFQESPTDNFITTPEIVDDEQTIYIEQEQEEIMPLKHPVTIEDLISASHRLAVEKGWWEGEEDKPRSVGDQFANFHAEISEAWEEYRKHGMNERYFLYREVNHEVSSQTKPEGIAAELADVLIRIADTCGRYNIPLEEALIQKMEYNSKRTYRHGNKKA